MSADKSIQRSGDVQDERLKALYAYKAAKDLKDLSKTLSGGLTKENIAKDVAVSVSIGSSQTTSEQNTHTETVNTSNINAGGNVTITATAGDINLKGTNINATDITLDAKKNINIESAENKQKTDSKTDSSSWSVGASFGLTTKGIGYFGNFSSGTSNENGNSITNTGSVIDASGLLTLKSGKDTNINGSQVKGDEVFATIDGNLNIASKQDTEDYISKNQNLGLGFTAGGVPGSRTGSFNTGKTNSTYASVKDQAGIFAGKDGFDIYVGKNTDLKGAVIASEAEAAKNALSTGTITFSNMENRAKYNSSSTGVSYQKGEDVVKKDKGFTPIVAVTSNGDADSTTKSAISPGKIDIRSNPNQDLSKLSRDTTNSVNTLGKIFDKGKIEEQRELANMFGEQAFKLVGDLGLKEGSPEKAAITALVGGINAQLGGGDFASGAAGPGFTQLLMNELTKIKNPALLQWVTFITGSVAAKLVGGDGLTGGSVTLSDIRNNFLNLHKMHVDLWVNGKGYIKVEQAIANGDAAIITVKDQGIDVTDMETVKNLFEYIYKEAKADEYGGDFIKVQILNGDQGAEYTIKVADVQKYGFDNLQLRSTWQDETEFLIMTSGMEVIGRAIIKVATTNTANIAVRQAYVQEVRGLRNLEEALRAEGKSIEEIASALHQARRDLGIQYKDMTSPEMLEVIYARNLKKYGDKLGPTIQWLRERGKSWEEIIESAKSPGKEFNDLAGIR